MGRLECARVLMPLNPRLMDDIIRVQIRNRKIQFGELYVMSVSNRSGIGGSSNSNGALRYGVNKRPTETKCVNIRRMFPAMPVLG